MDGKKMKQNIMNHGAVTLMLLRATVQRFTMLNRFFITLHMLSNASSNLVLKL